MKNQILIFITLSVLTFVVKGQTWQSVNNSNFYNTIPWGQFVINQFTNDIWLVNDNKVALIENSGFIQPFGSVDFGELWTGDHLRLTFTSDSVFYMKRTFGLFNFTDYVSIPSIVESEILDITANADTVFIIRSGSILKYIDGNASDSYFNASDIISKNEFLYSENGVIGHNVNYSNVLLWDDPHYLLAPIRDKKFQRHTDSLYVATKKGVMYAFNYDILDTITPNNTLNMPSPNVLEIEFDNNDNLWAVFGDSNDVPFAISKLEGNTWTSRFDNTNSPIDFSNFYGLEIDTLGNLWVADLNYLHTFLTPNSPTWLGTENLTTSFQINIFPNPSSDNITISEIPLSLIGSNATITDLNGKQMIHFAITDQQQNLDCSTLKNGVYFLRIGDVNQKIIKD
jgi:hypothetical protein